MSAIRLAHCGSDTVSQEADCVIGLLAEDPQEMKGFSYCWRRLPDLKREACEESMMIAPDWNLRQR